MRVGRIRYTSDRNHFLQRRRRTTVQAQISLLIDQQPGSLFRVVTALRRFGLVFEDDALSARQVEEGYNVSLRVDGATVPTIELKDQLRSLRGVTRVRDVRRLLPPLGGPDFFMASSGEPESESGTDGRESQDDERRRRHESAARIDALIKSYPAITDSVYSYIESVENVADRDALTRSFGLRCGRRLAAVEGRFSDIDGLDAAMDKVLRGFLFPIARIEISGRTLSLDESVFTDPDRANASAIGSVRGIATCCFLQGMIEGMLNHARGLPDLRVTEPLCRHRGDSECEFRIEKARGQT